MSISDRYVTASEIQKRFGISSTSLRRWDKDGKVKTVRTPGGFRLYSNDIEAMFQQPEALHSGIKETQKERVCYARVSSHHQKQDLERQIQDLQKLYPNHTIVSDIGSGVNFKRPQFQALLERILSASVEQLVVSHRDRLCRIGFDLLEFICKKSGTQILVSGQDIQEHDSSRELANDLLSVVNFFVAKNNGMRAAENRRKRSTDSEQARERHEEEGESQESDREGPTEEQKAKNQTHKTHLSKRTKKG